METISYTSFRKDLASILDKVNQDHVPMLVTRQNGESAVIMSAKDFRSYEETAYLMANARNAARLNAAIEEIEAGQAQPRELIDDLP